MTDITPPPRWVAEPFDGAPPASAGFEAPEGDPEHDCTGEAVDPDDGMDGVDLPAEELPEEADDGA